MAGRILFDAASPALDDDGNPISGTYLEFRLAGTTTQLDVYTTIDLDEAHPNPMRSDDAGRTDQVWAPDAAVYDIVWQDGDGVDIKTLYNVGAIPNGGVSASARLDAYVIPMADLTTAVTSSSSVPKQSIRMPFAWTLTGARGFLYTAQTSGSLLTVDIKVNGTSVFSTLLTFDNAERTTTTAGTPAVLSTTSIPDDAVVDLYVTQVGDGTAIGVGASLIGYPTL
jgi:hypothetical protein